MSKISGSEVLARHNIGAMNDAFDFGGGLDVNVFVPLLHSFAQPCGPSPDMNWLALYDEIVAPVPPFPVTLDFQS